MLTTIVGIIGSALLAVIGWAFSLNSRVAVLESDRAQATRREEGLKELVNIKLEGISLRLERIERKLDREDN